MYYAKMFEVCGDYYVYDALCNKITPIDKNLAMLLAKDNLDDSEMLNYSDMIESNHIRDIKAFYSPEFVPIIEGSTIPAIYDKNISQITLSLTENCNLRCEYCCYHAKYGSDVLRNEMSYDTIKKSIDFLFEHSSNKSYVSIAFYGGEPLLCFRNIKKIIEYINSEKRLLQHITFLMTTNGILLTDPEICEFLAHNKFHLTISLDGPCIIHDAFRKNLHGEGSYNDTIKGIKYLKDNYNDYFKNYVRFNSVNPYSEIPKTLYEYFINNHLDNSFSPVTSTDYFEKYIKNKNNLSSEYCQLDFTNFNIFEDKRISEKYAPVRYRHFIEMKESNCPKKFKVGGCCLPGLDRLYISVNGDMYPCEKVDEQCDLYKIGNVDKGFDFDKIRNLINKQHKEVNLKCKKCWAFSLCTSCFDIFNYDNASCDYVRARIENDIKIYIKNILFKDRYIQDEE